MPNLKQAVRGFLRSPFVTIVAILSLALGIGANAAIFSLFHQILLRDLPVPEPDRLVNLSSPGPKQGSTSCNDAGNCDSVFSYPMFRDLEAANSAFTGIAAHVMFGANLGYDGLTLSGRGVLVSGSYFATLGLQPALGRFFGPDDDRILGEPRVVVLSHAYWRTRFQESSEILNQTLIVNGQPMTIVGVASPEFHGTEVGSRPEVFIPITVSSTGWPNFNSFENRRRYFLYLFARLKPGATMEQAATAINLPYRAIISDVEATLQQTSPQRLEQFKAKQIQLQPGNRGQSQLHTEARTPLALLLAITVFVLLIACVNVANLLLARASGRAGEMALRMSIGAKRTHLIAQLLTESCLLAVIGGAAGLVVAQWTLDLIASLVPLEVTQIEFRIDATVLLFVAALTLGTGIVFGLFPALNSSRPDLVSTLKAQAGQPGGSRAAKRFRTALATFQIALSMALLVIAGLFIKSLFNISRVSLGLDADNIVTFGVSPGLNGYTPERSLALFERIEDEVRAFPGVTSLTASTQAVLSGNNWGSNVSVQGFEGGPDVDQNSSYSLIGTGYFGTLGISFVSGRDFTRSDAMGTPKVAIVNEAFARKFDLGRDAVGKRMRVGGGEELDVEIVGLVQNSKYSDVKQDIPPVFFLPYRQSERAVVAINYYVRSALPTDQLQGAIPGVVARVDPDMPVEDLQTLRQVVRMSITVDRVVGVLSAAFAVLATALAAIGLYGVLAYTVAQRTREIGVRMALGADAARVRAMVLRQVGWMTVIGGAIGLAAAVAIGQFAQALLYQLDGHDTAVLGVSAVLLALIALGAGFIPAHRASRVDPIRALRYE